MKKYFFFLLIILAACVDKFVYQKNSVLVNIPAENKNISNIDLFIEKDVGKDYSKIFLIPSNHISLKENKLNNLNNHFWGTPFLIIRPDGEHEFYFRINHEGHDLLHIHDDVFSFFVKADSIFYKFKSVGLPAEEKIFIYQCFQKHALNINIEQEFYPISKEEMKKMFFAKKLRFRIVGKTGEFVSEIPSETRKYWREFYREYLE